MKHTMLYGGLLIILLVLLLWVAKLDAEVRMLGFVVEEQVRILSLQHEINTVFIDHMIKHRLETERNSQHLQSLDIALGLDTGDELAANSD